MWRTVRTCLHIIVHNCHTQHSTEQSWLLPLLTSRQSSQLRCWHHAAFWRGVELRSCKCLCTLSVRWKRLTVSMRTWKHKARHNRRKCCTHRWWTHRCGLFKYLSRTTATMAPEAFLSTAAYWPIYCRNE